MSKKRKRDVGDVDVDLVEIYDHLAHENESERLQAAHRLISKISHQGFDDSEQIKKVLTRLFRGLCSSRKAARHGFAIALTELLSQLPINGSSTTNSELSPSILIRLLEKQTSTDMHNSGQDERDHYFGRLFGADAIIRSGIMFKAGDHDQWKRLLDVICNISHKKPWLRRECGWILYTSIASLPDQTYQTYAVDIIEVLTSNKLIRSPEGVAIWIAVVDKYPQAKLPEHVWKYGHPLAVKDVKGLAEVLKDAKGQSDSSEGAFESQGTATWSIDLHFVWDVVLAKLFEDDTVSKPSKKQLRFEDFWTIVVSDNLFKDNSSVERKVWGFSLWARIIRTAPPAVMGYIFTKDAVHCLVTALAGENSYYRRNARKVVQLITHRAEVPLDITDEASFASECLVALIQAADFSDFDQLTKTKTIEELLQRSNKNNQTSLFKALMMLLESVPGSEVQQTQQRSRYILNLQSKLFSASIRVESTQREVNGSLNDETSSLSLSILEYWTNLAYFSSEVSDVLRKQVKEKLASGFEQCLRSGGTGRAALRNAIENINIRVLAGTPSITEFDERVSKQVTKAFKTLSNLPPDSSLLKTDLNSASTLSNGVNHGKKETLSKQQKKAYTTFTDGLALLYCLTLFEVYNGEAEAVEILEDLSHTQRHTQNGAVGKGSSKQDDADIGVDSLIETLLSFAAKPSKFMRRATIQIFESLTSQVTSTGLQSLIRILTSKENSQGQQEMFEAGDVGGSETSDGDGTDDATSASGSDDDSEPDSDVEMLDSDVEVVSASEDTSEEDSDASSSDSDDNDGENEDANEDDELAAFDAALATALGTQGDDNASDSDEDMDDDEMTALDEKLTEVFKARKAATSKKSERKDAKENIVNFKNRVLDMVEAYLKLEYLNPLSTELIIPLLLTTRTTQTKQIAEKSCNLLREYCGRCKGQNVPAFDSEDDEAKQELFSLLSNIHSEACMESSNAHSAAASQASLLVVKTLLSADAPHTTIVQVYSDTRLRQLTDAKCNVQPSFFTDWNNWCTSARALLNQKSTKKS